MPIYEKLDKKGPYFQYGSVGKKYYFLKNSKISRDAAYQKALKQTKAIHASEARKHR